MTGLVAMNAAPHLDSSAAAPMPAHCCLPIRHEAGAIAERIRGSYGYCRKQEETVCGKNHTIVGLRWIPYR